MDTQEYLLAQLKTLTGIPSPTGMTREVTDYLLAELTRLGFQPERAPKGTVICCLGGTGHPLALSAHVDTLGAMVCSEQGTLAVHLTETSGEHTAEKIAALSFETLLQLRPGAMA